MFCRSEQLEPKSISALTQTWVLGIPGESCDITCEHMNATCLVANRQSFKRNFNEVKSINTFYIFIGPTMHRK